MEMMSSPGDMDDEKLIALIQSFPCLYTKRHPDFKNSTKRERIWATISLHMSATVELCQTRWRILRERYAREKRCERINSADENASRSKWLFMEHMAFLEPHIHPRTRKCWVQCGDEKKFVYKMDDSDLVELEETIELMPVLMDEEQIEESESPCNDDEAAVPMPTANKRPQQEATKPVSAAKKRLLQPDNQQLEPVGAASVRGDSMNASVLLQIIDRLSAPQEEDADELFGRMVASELRSVKDLTRKRRLKFEIQAILFGESE